MASLPFPQELGMGTVEWIALGLLLISLIGIATNAKTKSFGGK
jgi:hypothetical protein